MMTFNTRDTAELAHFKNLSSTWWDEEGPLRLLHAITPLRMSFLTEKVGVHFGLPEKTPKPLEGLRILDVGCGGGLLCEPLARLGAHVTGIDAVEENVKMAQSHADVLGLPITYLSCAVEDLPNDLPLFDVVVASEIIEHVTHPHDFLEACVRRLKTRGGLLVTTLNKTLKSYLLGIIAAEYILKWAPQGTHSWDKFISPKDLSHKLKDLGLNHQDITGLQFSLLTRGWKLSACTDVNYFLWAARL